MTKGNQLQLLVCSANLGNAQPDEDSLAAWIPENGRCQSCLKYPANYPIRDQFSTFDEYLETDQFDIIVIGMQEATFDPPKANNAVASDDGLVAEHATTHGTTATASSLAGISKAVANLSSYVTSHDHTKKQHSANNNSAGIGTFRKSTLSHLPEGTTTTSSSDGWNLGTRVLHGMLERRLPSYTRMVSYQRGQMRLEVFCVTEEQQQLQVEVIHTTAQNTGRAGLANKGGIVTELLVNGKTRLSFLTAHLEAHEGAAKYALRCSSLHDILAGTRHQLHDISLSAHYSFVLGDLNFRSELLSDVVADVVWTEDEHKKRIRDMVKQQDWAGLNEADELHRALRRKDCLVGYQTLFCNFPPTFKMERQRGYQYIDKRRPSYTDRILWKTGHELEKGVRPLLYEPIDLFASSDHKPVRAAFAVTLNTAMAFRPKLARRRSAIQLGLSVFGGSTGTEGVVSGNHRLHLFISDMNCFLVDSSSTPPNPYVCLVSTPEQVFKKSTSSWDRWKDLFGCRSSSGVAVQTDLRTIDGWPQAPVQRQTLQPCWPGEVFNTEVKTYLQDGTPLDLTGAMIHVTVMDSRPSGSEDQVLGTFSYNLGHLVNTFRPPAAAKEQQQRPGHLQRRGSIVDRMFRHKESSQTTTTMPSALTEDTTDPIKSIPIDAPLVRNGLETGRIRFTMEAWWIDETMAKALGGGGGGPAGAAGDGAASAVFSARRSDTQAGAPILSSRRGLPKTPSQLRLQELRGSAGRVVRRSQSGD